ncbi:MULTISPECIES: nSTAND1 domain-containing NTPase [unclassified Saccharothrix]|uniref:nSTAND1 domain-containing NTPase n=1 Tax=unclassified Saccharothrix TaxID=2593673 RepID=UPI00307EB816
MNGLGGDPLDHSVVRLRAGEQVLGAGFLVAPDVIATCAHVVDGVTPVADFPMLGGTNHAVHVLQVDPDADVAILRVTDPPPGALPVAARISGDVRGHRFRTFGFPRALPDGRWVTGRLVGAQAGGRIQMALDPGGRIERGFSGGPVWDEESAGVVGMVVTYMGGDHTVAHLVPTTALGDTWTAPPRNPYPGLRPFGEDDAALFHGRDEDVERLVRLLGRQDVVAVAGPSGSGKSSLVRAGLVPRLREDGAHVHYLGPNDPVPAAPEPGTVLVLDQFEETVVAAPAAARERLAAITGLVAGAREVRAVLTLRSRSLDDLIAKDTVDGLNRAVWFLDPMSREQLAAAIEGPAATVGGLAFESGLVQRILDDTAAEPGSLPLVSLVLDQLWQHRHGGWLTHAAYEELGRVPGALTTAAEDAVRSLEPARRSAARRLLTSLTRADGEGGHARRATLLADLDQDLRDTAHDLAAKRLVVVQDETVNLAHQALIDHWPQLRAWLAEDAKFLTWRAKLRDLRDAGGVLRDVALAEASGWLRDRPQDIPEDQRQFIRRSAAAQRRAQYRWRTITAVSVVLTLVASVLVVVVLRTNVTLDDRLRSINAATLAEAANQATGTYPAKALQLALAAWREHPGSVEAWGALLQQRLYWRGVDRVLPGPPFANVQDVLATGDGRVVVLTPVDNGDAATVWRDLLGPNPTSRRIPTTSGTTFTLSPDGRVLAARDQQDGLRVWDLDRSAGPVALTPGASVEHLGFSADGRYLAAVPTESTPPESLLLWDLRDLTAAPTRHAFHSGPRVEQLRPSLDGRSVVTVEPIGPDHAAVTRDLATGTVLQTSPAAPRTNITLLDGGTKTAVCADAKLTVHDSFSGATTEQPIAEGPCYLDAGGRYLVQGRSLLDWSTGSWHTLENFPEIGPWDAPPLFVPAGDNGLTALSARNGVVQISTPRTIPGRLDPVPQAGSATADGSRWVTYARPDLRTDQGQIVLTDAVGTVLHRAPLPDHPNGVFFDGTGERVLVVDRGTLRVFRTDGLVPEREVPLPYPPGREGDQSNTGNASLHTTPDGVTLISHLNVLSFWDVATGTQTAPPTVLDPPKEWLSLSGGPEVVLRPGHDHLLIQTDKGLELWDFRARERLHTFDNRGAGTPVVSEDGTVAAVQHSGSTAIDLFDLVGRKPLGSLNVTNQEPVGITGDHLFTKENPGDSQVWNWKQRKQVAALDLRTNTEIQEVEGDVYYPDTRPGHRDPITLDPTAWFDHLCQLSDRDFTDDERAALPEGVDPRRPCAR